MPFVLDVFSLMFYKECARDLELLDSFNKKLAMLPDWILTGFITTEITSKFIYTEIAILEKLIASRLNGTVLFAQHMKMQYIAIQRPLPCNDASL